MVLDRLYNQVWLLVGYATLVTTSVSFIPSLPHSLIPVSFTPPLPYLFSSFNLFSPKKSDAVDIFQAWLIINVDRPIRIAHKSLRSEGCERTTWLYLTLAYIFLFYCR